MNKSIGVSKVSIVIVNYNSTERLMQLLSSLSFISTIIGEIIIIDNNSSNFDKKKVTTGFRQTIIVNKNNQGFSKAVNQGISISKHSVILLLNPDCLIVDSSPIHTFNLINNNKYIGQVGGKIISSENKLRMYTATTMPDLFTAIFEFTNFKKIFNNNWATKKFWIETKYNIEKPILAHSLCGAYLFFRKNIKLKFSEKYFLYMEDLDFGDIVNKNKLETWFDPSSKVYHYGGGSNNSKYRTVLRHWYKSRKVYFKNKLPILQNSIVMFIFLLEEFTLKIYNKLSNTPNE